MCKNALNKEPPGAKKWYFISDDLAYGIKRL